MERGERAAIGAATLFTTVDGSSALGIVGRVNTTKPPTIVAVTSLIPNTRISSAVNSATESSLMKLNPVTIRLGGFVFKTRLTGRVETMHNSLKACFDLTSCNI